MDSGEPSKPERFASTTTGRLLLAELMARASFLGRKRKQCAGSPVVGAVGGDESETRHGLRFDADQAYRIAAEMGIPHHGCLG